MKHRLFVIIAFFCFCLSISNIQCAAATSHQKFYADNTKKKSSKKNKKKEEQTTTESGLSQKSSVEINPNESIVIMPSNEDDIYDTGNKMIQTVKLIVFGCLGFFDIISVGCVVFHFMSLGKSGSRPEERKKALKGLGYSGVAVALLGSITLVYALFYNII